MAQIEIKITIPEWEYKDWDDFHKGGIELAGESIKKQIADRLRGDYITNFDIEVTNRN